MSDQLKQVCDAQGKLSNAVADAKAAYTDLMTLADQNIGQTIGAYAAIAAHLECVLRDDEETKNPAWRRCAEGLVAEARKRCSPTHYGPSGWRVDNGH